ERIDSIIIEKWCLDDRQDTAQCSRHEKFLLLGSTTGLASGVPSRGSLLPHEATVEKVGRRLQDIEPGPVREKGVDLVGDDQLLDLDTGLAQILHETDALAEGNVTIVVTVNDKHRRAPILDRGDR